MKVKLFSIIPMVKKIQKVLIRKEKKKDYVIITLNRD